MRIVSRSERVVLAGLILIVGGVLRATPARAQGIEASVFAGYTASEGIKASDQRQLLGQSYDTLDITSGGSWGFTVGYLLGPKVEIEFLYARQFSGLEVSNPAPSLKLADQSVDNYHGNFVYHFGEADSKVRPFVFGGLGMTRFIPGDYDSGLPSAGLAKIGSVSKFSSTWGGGVKFYPSPRFGIKVMGRYTPTYIKTDPDGLWCDPFYPTCWVVGDPDYVNQFEMSGGVTFRFGR